MTPQKARVWLQTALSELDRAEKNPTADDEIIYRCAFSEDADPEDLPVLFERQTRDPEFLDLCVRRMQLHYVLRDLAYWLTNERWPASAGSEVASVVAQRICDDLVKYAHLDP